MCSSDLLAVKSLNAPSIITDISWYLVRNTRGVTGFVGSGNKPVPLSEKEVEHNYTLYYS